MGQTLRVPEIGEPEHPPVHRTDLLPSNMTAGKRDKVLDLLDAYVGGSVARTGLA